MAEEGCVTHIVVRLE